MEKQQMITFLEKHKDEIKNCVFLPVFIEALVVGGIELFDEVRNTFELAGVDLTNADFSRLK